MSATLEQLLQLARLEIDGLKAREQAGAEAYHQLVAERDRWMRTANQRGEEILSLRAGRLVSGVLVRAGTFTAGDEEVSGFIVSCTPEQLAAVPHLPMYRVVSIHVDDTTEVPVSPQLAARFALEELAGESAHPTVAEAQATS